MRELIIDAMLTIAVFLLVIYAIFWALNVLFDMHIAYTFKNVLASFVIFHVANIVIKR